MTTEMLQYLDPDGLDETVLNIGQIKTNLEGQISSLRESIEEEMQDLPYARPDGLYPDMTVGAVIGADDTAQWATRVTAGSGTATVRSVQGATEVQDGALVPVRIAGIASTDANGNALDSIEWTAQTLRAAGSVRDELTSDELVTRVGVVDLGTLTWLWNTSWQTWYTAYFPDVGFVGSGALTANVRHVEYPATSSNNLLQAGSDVTVGVATTINTSRPQEGSRILVRTGSDSVQPSGLLFYQLATPTTTPISPALTMAYRVQQGGTESIIVPEGEISAAPVLTVAEPVNAGDEFVRIWAAIQSLGYTRNTAQLSHPVSLTDIGSVDEVQKDTAEIDTTKEVTE